MATDAPLYTLQAGQSVGEAWVNQHCRVYAPSYRVSWRNVDGVRQAGGPELDVGEWEEGKVGQLELLRPTALQGHIKHTYIQAQMPPAPSFRCAGARPPMRKDKTLHYLYTHPSCTPLHLALHFTRSPLTFVRFSGHLGVPVPCCPRPLPRPPNPVSPAPHFLFSEPTNSLLLPGCIDGCMLMPESKPLSSTQLVGELLQTNPPNYPGKRDASEILWYQRFSDRRELAEAVLMRYGAGGGVECMRVHGHSPGTRLRFGAWASPEICRSDTGSACKLMGISAAGGARPVLSLLANFSLRL